MLVTGTPNETGLTGATSARTVHGHVCRTALNVWCWLASGHIRGFALAITVMYLASSIGNVASAATFISDRDGDWGNAATWYPDTATPKPGDTVFANHRITVESNHGCSYLSLNNSLTVLSGCTL